MEKNDYLVLSRGKWDSSARKEDIEDAITRFYDWLNDHLEQGRMRGGSRLGTGRAKVSRDGIVVDSALCEGKEVIGGYWFIVASSLEEAAALLAESPCAAFGLEYEIRPLEAERGSVYNLTNETPQES